MTPTVSARRLWVSAFSMLAAIAALHFVCLHFYPKKELDIYGISDFYPLSVFNFRRPQAWQLGFAFLQWLGLAWLWQRLEAESRWARLVLAGLALAVLSNLLHGWRFGIDYPTATWGDGGIEYYHDAVLLKGPLWFLARFNAIQFELLEHARTHPPGPVLFYYALFKLLRIPGLISIGVAAAASWLTLPAFGRLLRLSFGQAPRGAVLLLAILPGTLIYGLAVVDAVIAGLFLEALVNFIDDQRPGSWAWAACFLALSAFFTFGVLFLLPVFAGFELWRRRSLKRTLLVVGLAALALAWLKPLTGFNWLQAFFKASAMENEKGFLLFADPRRYLWYRLGAGAEILFFFTPFLAALMAQGVGSLRRDSPDAYALAWLGPLSLAAMLLAGAMKIGEAARICLFILPYLLLPVTAAWRGLDGAGRRRVGLAVFAWGLLMQLFGFFQW